MNEYYFENQHFVIKNYLKQKTFTNFLPGIAGKKGKPIWMFYANRGQCITSFGIKNKAFPILEFSPASIAFQRVSSQGFRTFIKIKGHIYEPFRMNQPYENEMRMNNVDLTLSEYNPKEELNVTVKYFTMPEEDYPALVRVVEIQNNSTYEKNLEIYDGLSELIPYGLSNKDQKECGNLFRSWMSVENTENQVPLYRLRSSTADSSSVEEIKSSYFFLSYASKGESFRIVDPTKIFDYDTSYQNAVYLEKHSFDKIKDTLQVTENSLPCAFLATKATLDPNEKIILVELYGFNEDGKVMNLKQKEADLDFISRKWKRNEEIIEELLSEVKTKSSNPLFDQYVRQCYLDNLLRGGYPCKVGDKITYLYSRKHGDPERDYNWFIVKPEYYSYGDGNFRDVLQNRRNDVLFHPEIKDYNVRLFASLIQMDGYNPLVVDGISFHYTGTKSYDGLSTKLLNHYSIGALYQAKKDLKEEELIEILNHSEERIDAKTREGYWCDHFIYLLDIITSYEKIYPDQFVKHFNEKKILTYYNLYQTRDYDKRFVLKGDKVRRLDFISEHAKQEEEGKLWYKDESRFIQCENKTYYTSLAGKLFHLIMIKMASLDPYGMGLDMDGGKPGWNDALNGVAGMFGSSVTDLMELYRLSTYFYEKYQEFGEDLSVGIEQKELYDKLSKAMKLNDLDYYQTCLMLKQEFRHSFANGSLTKEVTYPKDVVLKLCYQAILRMKKGLLKTKKYARNPNIVPTYFSYKVTKYELLEKEDGVQYVKPLEFEVVSLPSFLEGVAKSFKIDLFNKKKQYQHYIHSDGYDHKLHLARVSESLEKESMEIGRIRSFTPGWLERESCFLHMDYKFLLGLLEGGLYEEFYTQMKTNLVPFMNPKKYGRSTLENSSFIATSNFINKDLQGQGFQPRLSGANAEFLSMWVLMFIGKECFTYENSKLNFVLHPLMDQSFFDENHQVQVRFMNRCDIIYINENNVQPYQNFIQKMKIYYKDQVIEVEGNRLLDAHANALRNGQIVKIEAYF